MFISDFNREWKFHVGLNSAMAAGFIGSVAEEREVDLPHDAMISAKRSKDAVSGAGGGFFEAENCEYTKKFFWPEENNGKVAYLEFDGVYTNATILVNGDYAGACHNGYANFLVEIQDFLIPGSENQVKVVVKNSMQPNGRWYTGAGIYRDVKLLTAGPLHILPYGVKITTSFADEDVAVLDIEAEVRWDGIGGKNAKLVSRIVDSSGKIKKESAAHFFVGSKETTTIRQKIYLKHPQLWEIDAPYCYRCECVLETEDQTADSCTTTFGIRTLQLDPVHGLRLNGKTIKLRGGCLHHDNGLLGAVSLPDAEERRVSMMKKAGYNALRGAHNPMSRTLLETCDRLGMLVMEEFTDTWTHTKMDYDYGFFFPEEWEKDIEQMVRRDYNHPCIIMYSIGNEIPETGSERGAVWGRKMAEKLRSLDATRFITNGVNIMMSVIDRIGIIMKDVGMDLAKEGYSPAEINDLMNDTAAVMSKVALHPMAEKATSESFELLDIIGLNYAEDVAVEQHTRYPDRIYLGSETLPKNLDKNWELVEKYDHIIGDFSWTAWDYLGEAGVGRIEEQKEKTTGMQGFMGSYPWLAAYTGDFDLTGFRRPVSYWRETIWNGRGHQPYIAVQNPFHIGKNMFRGNWCWTDSLHSWNWPGAEGKEIYVEVYSDAQETELFVNGKSLGKKTVGAEGKKCYCKWRTVYQPGQVEAVSYIDMKEVGRTTLSTPGKAELCLETDKSILHKGSGELAYVVMELRDEQGILQMQEDRKLKVSVTGAAKLLACGSGNPCTEEGYAGTEHMTYQGRLLAVVQEINEEGKVKIAVEGENLARAETEIVVE